MPQPIILGKGWGELQLGASYPTVKDALGEPDEQEICYLDHDDWAGAGTYKNYCQDGFQIVIDSSEKIRGVRFFAPRDPSSSKFHTFLDFYTEQGIDPTTSIGKIHRICGTPLRQTHHGRAGGYIFEVLTYRGYDFWFENDRLISIGILPPRQTKLNDDAIEALAESWLKKLHSK